MHVSVLLLPHIVSLFGLLAMLLQHAVHLIYIRSTHLQRHAAGMLCGDAMGLHVAVCCCCATSPCGLWSYQACCRGDPPLYIAVHFVNVPCARGQPQSSHTGIHEVWPVTQARISLLVRPGSMPSLVVTLVQATDAWSCHTSE